MDNASINSSKKKNKSNKTSLFPIVAGVILVICLAFFFCTLSDIAKSKNEPEVFDIRAVSATDTSLLLSWNCTPEAEEYSVKCIDGNGENIATQSTDTPFAVLRDLEPNTQYTIEVSAFKDGTEYPSSSASVSTGQYCAVTLVKVTETNARSVTISWDYTGADNGFTAVAYVIDINGKRHLTTDTVKIAKGQKNECVIEGLLPDTEYTVTVMPNTKFRQVYKTNFITAFEKISYNKFTIIRTVICDASTDTSPNVLRVQSLMPSTEYKISMIISGEAAKDDTVEMALLIKDKHGNLVSETNFGEVYTNPNGSDWYKHRVILLSFTSPSDIGEYQAYITFDGEIASKITFETANPMF